MNPLDTEFHRRFHKQADEEIASILETLASGHLDHLEYKRVCGRLKAIQDAQAWCEEIETNMNEGK